jgi:hypothetical protein
MDQLKISHELPHADDTDQELQPVEARPPSFPGARTPGRPTGPISKNRISNPNARSAPSRATGRPASAAMSRTSQPPTRLTPAPTRERGRTALFAGIGALALAATAVAAFVVLRTAPAPAPVVRTADIVRQEETPVFLSVVSEPLDSDVIATWKGGGEKRGSAPLSLEVPRNAKVHFDFRKAGFFDYAMDIIADQPQTVQAVLKAVPKPPALAVETAERKPAPEKKHRKERTPKVPDGVVDVLRDLK